MKFESCDLVVNPKYPFMGASLNGFVQCSCHGKSMDKVKYPLQLQ